MKKLNHQIEVGDDNIQKWVQVKQSYQITS